MAARSRIVRSGYTRPVGLFGEFTMSAAVRGPIFDSMAATSRSKSAFVGASTSVPPWLSAYPPYSTKYGTLATTSSPGSSRAFNAAFSPPAAPQLITTSAPDSCTPSSAERCAATAALTSG